jgi:hypothetical protein
MSIPFSHGTSFDTPTCIQGWVEYPFARFGNNTTKLYHHIMVQNGDVYTPLTYNAEMTAADEKPDRSPFADDSSAYWVEDRGQAPSGDNLITFDRIFSNIPLDYTEGGGIYAFDFPGNGNAPLNETYGTVVGTGDFLTRNGRVEMDFELSSADSESLGVGDKIRPVTGGSNVRFYGSDMQFFSGFYIIYEKNVSGSNFEYRCYMENYQAVMAIGTHSAFSTFSIERPAVLARSGLEAQNSESIITSRFVKTDDILTVKMEEKFKVLSTSIKFIETDTLTSSTYPSLDEYGGLSWVGGYLQAEPETPVRWLGNIWQIIGRKVKAR